MTGTVVIDGTEFYTNEGHDYVGEVGTSRKWSPRHPKGYRLVCRDGWNWRRVALTSFDDFGPFGEYADRWCEKARKAWDALKVDELAC